MTSLIDAHAGTVTRLWRTCVIVGSVGLDGITIPAPAPEGPPTEELAVDPASLAVLERQFLESMRQMADDEAASPVTGVRVTVSTWRAGYDDAAFTAQCRYAGWTILAASCQPATEAGCLTFSDPRAGSAMTAVPGLPFGRQLPVRPAPGAHVVVPGWLTASVIPLQAGQVITVAAAWSAR